MTESTRGIRSLISDYALNRMTHESEVLRDHLHDWVHERNPGKRINQSISVMTVNRPSRQNRKAYSNVDVDLFVERHEGGNVYLRLWQGTDDISDYFPVFGGRKSW